ncbi:hypothetical protein Tco_0257889 [Tanacetum coccineum]
MSSPNHSTSDIEDAFSSMNILNYTSVSSDYFPASSGSSSFNSSENSKDNIIPPVFSSFYNNPYLKDVQAFYAKELPISSPDPITPPAILTPSLSQTLEEAINIAQRLMDQIINHDSVQEANDHKRKLEDKGNIINNNYQNNYNNRQTVTLITTGKQIGHETI